MMRSAMLLLGCSIAWTLTMASGCSALRPAADKPLATDTGPKQECMVEFRYKKKSPKLQRIEIAEDTTVQTVLKKSGALKKFARMDIEIYRPLPQGGTHRMEVTYDRAAHRVDSMHDYQIRHGDRVVVIEDTSTVIDDVMESNFGPLAGKLSKR